MEDTVLENQKYPIGKFKIPLNITDEEIRKNIFDIEKLPFQLRELVSDFSDEQLNTKYREGGWTVRQVVHHVADSHMNSYMRFKLALTEDTPEIRPYAEDKWAELEDGKNCDIKISLALIDALHFRWVMLLKSMSKEDFEKKFYHPEQEKEFTLGVTVAMYSWHGRHHLKHISDLKDRNNW